MSKNWSETELILACDLVVTNGWSAVRANDSRAHELSELLRSLPENSNELEDPKFRSAGSVKAKTNNLVTARDSYHGKGTRGSALDEVIVQRFEQNKAGMQALARILRDDARTLWSGGDGFVDEALLRPAAPSGLGTTSAAEGRERLVRVISRERDPKLRAAKILHTTQVTGGLGCEVCGFDFQEVYGDRGRDYAEVHHVTPLHVSGEVETLLEDLAVLCANCHRMVHRGRTWLTPDQLRSLVEEQAHARA